MPGIRRYLIPDILNCSPVLVLVMVMVLVLILRLPHLLQVLCLSTTFSGVTAVSLDKETVRQDPGCLAPDSPLLAGSRGKARSFQIALAFGGIDAANRELERFPVSSTLDRMPYVSLGQAFYEYGQDSDAIQQWSHVDARQYLIAAGSAAHEVGDNTRALPFWEAARTLWRQNGLQNHSEEDDAIQVLKGLGRIWRNQDHEYRLAAEAYSELAVLRPKNVGIMLLAGQLYGQSGDPRQAEFWFEKALRAAPTEWRSLYRLGLLAMYEGEHELAIARYRQALDLDSEQAAVWFALGNAFKRTGEVDLAIHAFSQVIEIEPDHTEAQEALSRLGDPQ